MNEMMKKTLLEEETLQFDSFDQEDALQLGLIIIDLAKSQFDKGVAVEIEYKELQLFSHFMKGTTENNVYWINAKKNVVRHYGNSSHYVGESFREQGLNFHEASKLPSTEYQAEGGSFPLCVRGEGIVGMITVSGLTSIDDHNLVVDGIKAFLAGDMLQHTVFFNLNYEEGSPMIEQFLTDGYNILTTIPGVLDFGVLKQVSSKCTFTYGFSMRFVNKEAYQAYNIHPLHVDFVNQRWLKEVSEFQEIDFQR